MVVGFAAAKEVVSSQHGQVERFIIDFGIRIGIKVAGDGSR